MSTKSKIKNNQRKENFYQLMISLDKRGEK